jgi:L-fuculose-phosphate aldolase
LTFGSNRAYVQALQKEVSRLLPTPWQTRKRLLEICRLAAERGYVAAYEGNFSARLPDGRVLITPTRVNKAMLTDADLVVTDLAGNHLQGTRRASSEIGMHLAVYSGREDVGAIAHAHPPFASAFCVAGVKMCIDCMPETLVELRDIPLVPYATPGTHEVADRLRPALPDGEAFLLEQHGVLALGADVDAAYFRLELVEHAAEILHRAVALGGPKSLCEADRLKLARAHGKKPGREGR